MLFINCFHSRLLPTKELLSLGFPSPVSVQKRKQKGLFLNKIPFVVAHGLCRVTSLLEERVSCSCLPQSPP